MEDYRITNIGTLLQLFCNHVLSLIKNWRFLYKYALTCYYLSIYLKGVNKYAAKNSRVYIDISTENNIATFVIKNISENPLNIRPDELTERFVRGDVSRTTEGSGLGLSIAKSLTILQGGKFDIIIDGDLFKVQIRFKAV